jgi:hypothetical protein
LEGFLATLVAHPTINGFLARQENGVLIRFEVLNLIQWNKNQIWLLDGKVMEGKYEDMHGFRVRAWGLDVEGQRSSNPNTP